MEHELQDIRINKNKKEKQEKWKIWNHSNEEFRDCPWKTKNMLTGGVAPYAPA